MNIRPPDKAHRAIRPGLFAVLLLSALPLAAQAEPPRATLLEIHSCEVYAGGCIVSSQATLEGRYLVRAWNFTGGEFENINFAGLKLALVQTSAENLAAAEAPCAQGVAYLPRTATAAQRRALLAWLKDNTELSNTVLQTRVVDLTILPVDQGYTVTAGDFVSVTTAPLETCEAQACGEALWYTPRVKESVFTVVLNKASRVNEPLLKLKWLDAGKRSVFLAKVGNPTIQRNLYVVAADLCGPKSNLF